MRPSATENVPGSDDVLLSLENVCKDYAPPAPMRTRRFFARLGGLHLEDGFAPDAVSGQLEDDEDEFEDDTRADDDEELPVQREETVLRRVIDGVTLQARGGSVLGVVGPEGTGKTVLLKLMAGIVAPSEGRIVVRGMVAPALNVMSLVLPARAHRVGSALPMLGSMVGIAPHVVRSRFGEIAHLMQSPQLLRSSTTLMDSRRKRELVLAMALAVEPDILLLDIPIPFGDAFGERCVQRIGELVAGGSLVVLELRNPRKTPVPTDHVVLVDGGRIAAPALGH